MSCVGCGYDGREKHREIKLLNLPTFVKLRNREFLISILALFAFVRIRSSIRHDFIGNVTLLRIRRVNGDPRRVT